MAERERNDAPFDFVQGRPEQGGAASKDANTDKSEGPLRRSDKQGHGKRILLRTFGCQMNVRDSEVVCGLLDKAGYRMTEDEDGADVIIFNTCSVRQHAEDRVWSAIGNLTRVRKRKATVNERRATNDERRTTNNEQPIIGIVGCMANCYRDEIFRRAPAVDFVVGTRDIAKIPQIIDNLGGKKGTVPFGDSPLFLRKLWETDAEARPEEIYHTGFHLDKEHALVVISEGCENFCTYCVVPYVRGNLRHRNYEDILREIREAVDRGITKVTLLGQNVNAYGKMGTVPKKRGQSPFFIELLEKVNAIKGLKEFSFITSHPKDTSVELFRAMADCAKLKKCLHLPVQSGSDKILKAMNRGYSRKFYLDLADNYRKIVKNGVLTTDIIVGFPGESEKDFQETYDLINEVKFNAAYIFKYSPRPHTAAAGLSDDVPKEEKERRHRLILELQKKISRGKKE